MTILWYHLCVDAIHQCSHGSKSRQRQLPRDLTKGHVPSRFRDAKAVQQPCGPVDCAVEPLYVQAGHRLAPKLDAPNIPKCVSSTLRLGETAKHGRHEMQDRYVLSFDPVEHAGQPVLDKRQPAQTSAGEPGAEDIGNRRPDKGTWQERHAVVLRQTQPRSVGQRVEQHRPLRQDDTLWRSGRGRREDDRGRAFLRPRSALVTVRTVEMVQDARRNCATLNQGLSIACGQQSACAGVASQATHEMGR